MASTPVRLLTVVTLAQLSLSMAGCPKKGDEYQLVVKKGEQISITPCEAPTGGHVATFDGRIRLLQASLDPQMVTSGGGATLTLRFVALETLLDDWRIFVHGQLPGAELTQMQDDHEPLDGLYPTARWQRGDVVEERRVLRIPADVGGGPLEFYVGFYSGQQRMPVDEADRHDGHQRVKVGQLAIEGALVELPLAVALPAGAIKIDGQLDEPTWDRATRLGPFLNYHGRGVPSNSTYARLAYDDKALYLGFECADKDIWTSYTERDDPIYEQEAVEIFLDVDSDLKSYVELQTSPANVHFDAAFTGRRQNMDKGYNADYETAIALNGTLNDPSDVDRGWTAEWRIPYDQIRGLEKPPGPGESWRFNLFRLDKVRGQRVVNEASAWSAPLSGDFHNLQRFGTLKFGTDSGANEQAVSQPGARPIR